ncbi:MAG: hypothetical protein COV52_10325 [Gammaproteobacteria bacterium CG11_big_fil_rev_8_21_14_0_20_46_22]|nr:MAG: hypothetical protein COW05_09550 [Gammaproteobacteria bacterium CG12_big_fil_rev_8_21_14_0_65_46_12]PIR10092.1 MAG: hypothetical protein COV52_10325 [Gammaproteobacteria bacterium CG11_big_fil_rev_8_21_14_0_20_46_22]
MRGREVRRGLSFNPTTPSGQRPGVATLQPPKESPSVMTAEFLAAQAAALSTPSQQSAQANTPGDPYTPGNFNSEIFVYTSIDIARLINTKTVELCDAAIRAIDELDLAADLKEAIKKHFNDLKWGTLPSTFDPKTINLDKHTTRLANCITALKQYGAHIQTWIAALENLKEQGDALIKEFKAPTQQPESVSCRPCYTPGRTPGASTPYSTFSVTSEAQSPDIFTGANRTLTEFCRLGFEFTAEQEAPPARQPDPLSPLACPAATPHQPVRLSSDDTPIHNKRQDLSQEHQLFQAYFRPLIARFEEQQARYIPTQHKRLGRINQTLSELNRILDDSGLKIPQAIIACMKSAYEQYFFTPASEAKRPENLLTIEREFEAEIREAVLFLSNNTIDLYQSVGQLRLPTEQETSLTQHEQEKLKQLKLNLFRLIRESETSQVPAGESQDVINAFAAKLKTLLFADKQISSEEEVEALTQYELRSADEILFEVAIIYEDKFLTPLSRHGRFIPGIAYKFEQQIREAAGERLSRLCNLQRLTKTDIARVVLGKVLELCETMPETLAQNLQSQINALKWSTLTSTANPDAADISIVVEKLDELFKKLPHRSDYHRKLSIFRKKMNLLAAEFNRLGMPSGAQQPFSANHTTLIEFCEFDFNCKEAIERPMEGASPPVAQAASPRPGTIENHEQKPSPQAYAAEEKGLFLSYLQNLMSTLEQLTATTEGTVSSALEVFIANLREHHSKALYDLIVDTLETEHYGAAESVTRQQIVSELRESFKTTFIDAVSRDPSIPKSANAILEKVNGALSVLGAAPFDRTTLTVKPEPVYGTLRQKSDCAFARRTLVEFSDRVIGNINHYPPHLRKKIRNLFTELKLRTIRSKVDIIQDVVEEVNVFNLNLVKASLKPHSPCPNIRELIGEIDENLNLIKSNTTYYEIAQEEQTNREMTLFKDYFLNLATQLEAKANHLGKAPRASTNRARETAKTKLQDFIAELRKILTPAKVPCVLSKGPAGTRSEKEITKAIKAAYKQYFFDPMKIGVEGSTMPDFVYDVEKAVRNALLFVSRDTIDIENRFAPKKHPLHKHHASFYANQQQSAGSACGRDNIVTRVQC